MAKKKKLKRERALRKKEELAKLERKGKCLRCGKPMVKNHKSCGACNRKDRLKSKASKRGKPKEYYLEND